MKKVLVVVLILTILCCLSGCGVSGRNVKISGSTAGDVSFWPKCPECGHLNELEIALISDGEQDDGRARCEKCDEIYEYSISR
ncbi:MAG: hypothetical protein J6D52_05940 [Clostridia bacterium]|nr:hypothetical protein [Clostridia bacterium]